jgi:hypothetical protein
LFQVRRSVFIDAQFAVCGETCINLIGECHAALNSRTGEPYLSALSAFLLQSHCTQITDICT